MIYKTTAIGSPSQNANFLYFDIHILRGEGDEFQQVAMFHKQYKIDKDDSFIVEDIWQRVQNYARVDSNRIAKEELDDRAESIAESLEDRSIEY